MKAYRGVEVQLHSFLTYVLAGKWVFYFMPQMLDRGQRRPIIHWTGGWVGPIAGMDVYENRKISLSCHNRTLNGPAHNLATKNNLVSQQQH